MSVLEMISSHEEDWIKKFGPQQRILTGAAYFLVKRVLDLVLVVITIPFWLPLNAVIALIIRITSPGEPVIFTQMRTGKGGRRFHMYKFRTMVPNAEELKSEYAHLNELRWPDFKITNDPRIIPIGRFLRKTSLDELPQLFNVLRGEMSLVGPRPLVTDEDAQVLGLDRSRLHLTPGMTGPWQVLGARVPMQEMVGIDYLYVASWSLWLDVKLLLRTVRHVLRRGNV